MKCPEDMMTNVEGYTNCTSILSKPFEKKAWITMYREIQNIRKETEDK